MALAPQKTQDALPLTISSCSIQLLLELELGLITNPYGAKAIAMVTKSMSMAEVQMTHVIPGVSPMKRAPVFHWPPAIPKCTSMCGAADAAPHWWAAWARALHAIICWRIFLLERNRCRRMHRWRRPRPTQLTGGGCDKACGLVYETRRGAVAIAVPLKLGTYDPRAA
jgi:hypothetical protein